MVRSTGPDSDPPQIGRYQVIRHLATGGMAQIYLARMGGMADFERHVVLKTISVSYTHLTLPTSDLV